MTPGALRAFWFAGDRETLQPRWFRADPAFDAEVRDRFGPWLAAAAGLSPWAATPCGALALAILLDQVPRNIHRGTAAAFAWDAAARDLARAAVLRDRLDLALTPTERVFLYLPFEHSEAMADQDLSVALFEGLRDAPAHAAPGGTIAFAWAHRAVIARFGRFPHRNAALGRDNTATETAWLQQGGGF